MLCVKGPPGSPGTPTRGVGCPAVWSKNPIDHCAILCIYWGFDSADVYYGLSSKGGPPGVGCFCLQRHRFFVIWGRTNLAQIPPGVIGV